MIRTSRRSFLAGASTTAALSCVLPGVRAAFGATNADTLVVVFLRGGQDGLNFIGPVNDPNYIAGRPVDFRVTDSGSNVGMPLNTSAAFDFRLNAGASALYSLYQAGQLAFVHATGLSSPPSHSHFDSQAIMESGLPSQNWNGVTSGWIGRYLQLQGIASNPVSALAAYNQAPLSLAGSATITTNVPEYFVLNPYQSASNQALAAAVINAASTSTPLAAKVQSAYNNLLTAINAVSVTVTRDATGSTIPYKPSGSAYPTNDDGRSFSTVARLIKANIGLAAATIDLQDWDTHNAQPGIFAERVQTLSTGLAALWSDIAAFQSKTTIIVMTEFGRRFAANYSNGTDHGVGGVAIILGGSVNGGKMYGTWPGLAQSQLNGGQDLAVTTDYRQIIAEALMRRTGTAKLGQVFPTLKSYTPLGLFKGTDLTPDYTYALS